MSPRSETGFPKTMHPRLLTSARRLCLSLQAVILLMALASAARAQEPGRVVGRVLDQDQGTPIAGAVVEVVSADLRPQSVINGRYTISRVPAGAFRVRVWFIRYQPQVIEGIQVPAGGVVEQNLAPTVEAIELEEITVAAGEEQGSVNRALDEQRNANNVVSSISSGTDRQEPGQ